MNWLVNETEGKEAERPGQTSAPGQALMGCLSWDWAVDLDGDSRGGRDSGGRLSMAQRSLAGVGTPRERETQGKGRVTHPSLSLNA